MGAKPSSQIQVQGWSGWRFGVSVSSNSATPVADRMMNPRAAFYAWLDLGRGVYSSSSGGIVRVVVCTCSCRIGSGRLHVVVVVVIAVEDSCPLGGSCSSGVIMMMMVQAAGDEMERQQQP